MSGRGERSSSANSDLVRSLLERELVPSNRQRNLHIDDLVGAWLELAARGQIATDAVVSVERHTYRTGTGQLIATTTADARSAWRFPECHIALLTTARTPGRFAPLSIDDRGGCFEGILRETRQTGWRGLGLRDRLRRLENVQFEPVAIGDESEIHIPRLWYLMHRWVTGTEPHWTDRFPPEVDAAYNTVS